MMLMNLLQLIFGRSRNPEKAHAIWYMDQRDDIVRSSRFLRLATHALMAASRLEHSIPADCRLPPPPPPPPGRALFR